MQESALYGEHIWFETSVSGDFCYVGEQHCYAKTVVRVAQENFTNDKTNNCSN